MVLSKFLFILLIALVIIKIIYMAGYTDGCNKGQEEALDKIKNKYKM